MSTIKLTDNFGLVIDVSPSALSIFSKYLKSPDAIAGLLRNAKSIVNLQVGQDPFQSQSVGLSFAKPVDLGTTGVELTINPQALATLAIKKGDFLFDAADDPFRDKIPVPANQGFVSAAMEAKLDVSLGNKMGDLQFGFTSGTDMVFTNYRIFGLTDQIVPSIETLLKNFVLPGDLQDADSMAAGSVATVEGTGSLKFSAKANLLSAINPLATAGASVVQGPLTLKEGASLEVSATYTLAGAYQVRVQRMTDRKFRLGYQRKRGSEFDVSVTADIGVSAMAGGFDVIKALLQSVSADPVPDKDVFQQGGLTDDQISTIATAIKTGIERSLELSLRGELDSLDSVSTAFSYEIDLDVLDAGGRQAVHDAFDGDLTGLEGSPMAGIKPLKSIFSTLKQGKRILRVNLLGIFNYASVTTLFQKGTIIVDRDSGDITITDEVGANRIQFTSDNFAKDGAKLRHVLADGFLMTVGYRTSKTVRVGPQLASRYWFFELHQKSNVQNLEDYLNIAKALQVISPEDMTSRMNSLNGLGTLGRSTFYVDSGYSEHAANRLFFDTAGQVRSQEDYECIGRMALQFLLLAGDPINDARRLPLTDDETWSAMKAAGQPNNFGGLFNNRGFNLNQLADISSDYTVITWWAAAMHSMSDALAAIVRHISDNPQWDPQDNAFKVLRSNVNRTMASVSSNTKPQFAEPWGLLAMDLASGREASIGVRIVSSRLSLVASSGAALAAATS